MKPLVSVIIPCYNYAHYLGEAIETAIAQTHRPLEIIVINDGSTDNTVEVASRYPVILYTQDNQGAGNTFNRGVELSKGEYIVILSADDRLHPLFVEKTLQVIEQNINTAFVYTHAYMFGTRKGKMQSREYNIDTLKVSNYIFGTSLIRREAFQKGGKFDPFLKCLEDYDLWLTFAEKKIYGKLLPEALFYYRQQTSSRNLCSQWLFRKTLFKIWRKHENLYTKRDIVKIIVSMRLQIISLYIINSIKHVLPPKLQRMLSKIEQKIRLICGVTIEEN